MAKHPSKKIKWKFKNIYNWLQKISRKRHNQTSCTFNFATNTYEYEDCDKLVEAIKEQEDDNGLEQVKHNGVNNICVGIRWRSE